MTVVYPEEAKRESPKSPRCQSKNRFSDGTQPLA